MRENICKMIILLLCALFIFPQYTSQTQAISQHEVADGTFTGYIENETHTSYTVHKYYCINDTKIESRYPDKNYDYFELLSIIYGWYGFWRTARSFVYFNISDILDKPSNINIISSDVWCKTYSSGTNGYTPIYMHKVNASWQEDTLTWNTKPEYDPIYLSSALTPENSHWYSFDATQAIQSMKDDTYNNHGFMFKTGETDYTQVTFYAHEQGTDVSPYLNVRYNIEFNGTRTTSANTEKNNFTFNALDNYSDDVTLKIPVSDDVRGITDVTNNTGTVLATEVNDTSELTNNTFWYDSANQYVYIRTINLTYGMTVNWTVNCSYGITFNIPIPTYKNVGEDISMNGRILNSSGVGMNASVRTHIYNSTGVDMITPVHEWYCRWGNYEATIPTSGLIPGEYRISIEVTDPETGIIFKYGDNLYLSFETPSGVYSDAIVHFSFYNTNIGLGLIPETFKVYIDDVRNYENKYYGYTGETINVTIKDYYNFIMRTDEITITETYTGLNYGLTFHEYDFTNENSEAYYASFLKDGGDRWYEKVVGCSGGQKSFMLPTGNYTIRVYNSDNSSYTTWTETVNRSKAYLIGTDGVSLIIQGQSVIIGEFLELNTDLDTIFMPDVEIISRNPPIVFSPFSPIGMEFGGSYYQICPPINVIAETRYEETGSWINNSALIPTNGTTENGSITLLEDTIYFGIVGGTIPAWVNISYTSNGTIIQNTTYIPSKFYPFGFDVTIKASADIRITRECRFNQLKMFYWDYYPGTDNPGWLYEGGKKRVGYHKTGLEVENTMNTIWYNVHVYAGFSTDTPEPDSTTVRLTDVDNGNTILEEGENFFVFGSGIAFRLTGSLNASETRSFLAEYYSSSSGQYHYGSEVIHIDSYQENKRMNEKLYNYFTYTWINSNDKTYRGTLEFYFDFPVETGIRQDDIIVYDASSQVNITDFIICDQYLKIGSDAVGEVNPGGGKTYEVYFKFDRYPGQNVEDVKLNTPQFSFAGIPISWSTIIIMIFLGMAVFGALLLVLSKQKKTRDHAKLMVFIGMVVTVITWVVTALGL